MDKKFKTITTIVAFILLLVLILAGRQAIVNQKANFGELNKKIAGYSADTLSRVNKSVITIPDEDTIVGLVNGMGAFALKTEKSVGNVYIIQQFLKTKFIEGTFSKKEPRLDAIAPMYIDKDIYDGSTYIVLFQDRGDVALEKSYARIGGSNVVIKSIDIIDPDINASSEEYRVNIKYKQNDKEKDITLRVIDGHFDSEIK